MTDEVPLTTGSEWAGVFFQFTFAAAATTIVSGAIAERSQLPAYLIFSSVMTGLIFPVVFHWAWSTEGWISPFNPDSSTRFLGGVVDFAGAAVVHMTGGVAGLCGAIIIGPRGGRFDAKGNPVPMPGHSSVLQVLGTFILWVGWYGFNAGSTLTLNSNSARTAGRAVLSTTLSAAAGGSAAVSLERMLGRSQAWDVASMCNGILVGLVSVTAGCATMMPWAAIIVGSVGACFYRLASHAVLRHQVDDPLDAFAVHGAGGCWSIIAASFFSVPKYCVYTYQDANGVVPSQIADGGVFYGSGGQLAAALIFALAIIAWVGSVSAAVFKSLKSLGCLRIPVHLEVATFTTGDGQTDVKGPYDADDNSTHGGSPFRLPSVSQDGGATGTPEAQQNAV